MQSAVHQLWKLPCSSLEKSDDSGNDGFEQGLGKVFWMMRQVVGITGTRQTSRARARSPGSGSVTVASGGKSQGPSQNTAYGFQSPAQPSRPSVGASCGSSSIPLAAPGNRAVNVARSSTSGAVAAPEPKTSRTSRLSVVVRKRPMNKREVQTAQQDVVMCRESAVIVREPKLKVDLTRYVEEHNFLFDQAFDETVTNESLYRSCVQPIIDAVFHRAKCTCFAYGQTGSGKTFTMMGPPKRLVENLAPEERTPGIFLLASQDIFRSVASKDYSHLGVFIAFYEIYCGKLFDLLNNRQILHARENAKGNVVIAGLQEHPVGNVQDLMEVIEFGLNSRTTGVTGANVDSSRSHAILQISLKDLESKEEHGKISFIDLAGSERGADTLDTDRQTRMDGAEINKSLLALKECIRALDQQLDHTPFRGSKLTQVLKDSFVGANCRTVMIANVSPCSGAVEHSLNTLRYAYRVKELRSAPAPSKVVTPPPGPGADTSQQLLSMQGDLLVDRSSDSSDEELQPPQPSRRAFSNDAQASPASQGSGSSWNGTQRLATSAQVANAVAAANAAAAAVLPLQQQIQQKELQHQPPAGQATPSQNSNCPPQQQAPQQQCHTPQHSPPNTHVQPSFQPPQPAQPTQPPSQVQQAIVQDPVAAGLPDHSQAALDELARQHDRLIGTILAEEEELITAHRQHIDMMVELIKEEMVHLNNVDRPGSDVDAYVNGLDRILRMKADYIGDIRSRVDLFKEHLAQEDALSRKFQSLASSSG
ncbi:Kinesin-13A [Symbiodinium microadriaticum]|uniref:Kinesin-like protein n=1 Tax=Symbiodinium microadriaticum TaxID=2951 RepID=A0A1Q9DKB7_SYMMI|nr:Kinesin-13A [Symbiodinium microadriaticum]CAE7238568.1 KIN13A [Symbiodinium microadriaticum]CAE7938883.1 KIN13A [Symbiodinium sp. KB8]